VSWPLVRLADVCSKISDGTHQAPNWATNGVPFLFVSNVRNGSISFDTNKFVSKDEYQKLTKHSPIEAGDVLYTAVGSYGNSAVVPRGKTFVFQRHIAHIKPNHNLLDAAYLSQMLETPSVRQQADRVARGVAQKTVTLSSLRKFQIHLPPLPEQRRIAAILEKADELRRKRKRALDLLDSLTQSIFLEMFGDPVSNPKGWRERPLADFESFLTSGSRGWAKYYSQSGKAFIRIQNLQQGELSTNDVQYVDAPNSAEARRTTVRSGDVLISITADLGRTAVVPDSLDNKAHINQHIALVRTKGINPTYLSIYLASRAGQLQFDALNRQGVKAGLNFDNIRSLRILEPPMALQNNYVNIRTKIRDVSKRYSCEALASGSLFSSLQHRAFSGQL
jgi:type I restriction enzyme S subunit